MLAQRFLWGGTTITTLILGFLTYTQVEGQLARWAFGIVLGLLFIASMIMFPWGGDNDGSARRISDIQPRGRRHATLVSDDAGPPTGNIQNTGDGNVTVTSGLTVAQISELKKHLDDQVAGQVEVFVERRMDAYAQDVAKYTGEANAQAMAMGRHLITEFVERMAERAPQNISSLGTADMQNAILNAQTSAAVTNDEDLAGTLVDILVDKSAAEPRSFKGVVLSEALLVAGKLTPDQINLLTALLIVERTIVHSNNTVESVLARLDSRCQPLYGKLPATKATLQYMVYTGVGSVVQTFPDSLSVPKSIADTYDAVFTNGFAADDLPDGLKQLSGRLPTVDRRISGEADRLRFAFASSQTLNTYRDEGKLNEPYLSNIEAMQTLISQGKVGGEKVMEIAHEETPALADFLSSLDSIDASTFELSSVGIAIGQANWRRLLPNDVPDVDIWLR